VINIKELTEKDIGRWVVYKDFGREEHGRIASFTSEYVFVVYDRNSWSRGGNKMFRNFWKILPFFLVVWLAKRKAERVFVRKCIVYDAFYDVAIVIKEEQK